MKRYLLFAGGQYYPAGGMNDFRGSFDTFDDAKDFILNKITSDGYEYDWGHVLDKEEGVETCISEEIQDLTCSIATEWLIKNEKEERQKAEEDAKQEAAWKKEDEENEAAKWGTL